MNIDKLNKKIHKIFQAHSLLNRDSINALEGAKIGIAEEFIRSKKLHNQLDEFKNFLDSAKINAVIVFTGPLNLYHHFNHIRLPPHFNPGPFEYIISPASSYAQLRYMYQHNFIQAIVALPQLFEYCPGFKELPNFITDIHMPSNSFAWIDVKSFTAKAQISLDASSELVLMFEMAQDLFTQEVLNQTAQSRFNIPYHQLTSQQKTDIAYFIAHQLFQGKTLTTLEARLTKNQTIFKQDSINRILAYYQLFKTTPVLQSNCEWYFQYDPSPNYSKLHPQLPTELIIMKSVGVGNDYHSMLINQQKNPIYPSVELTILNLEEKNQQSYSVFTSYLHSSYRLPITGANEPITSSKCYFSDELPKVNIQEAINYYYNKLKLTSKQGSRKGSESPGERKVVFDQQPTQINLSQLKLTTILRFLAYFEILIPEKNQATVLSSGLRVVKPQHSEQAMLLLYLIQSEVSQVIFYPLMNYYFQFDLFIPNIQVEQLGRYREIYNKNKSSYPKIQKQSKSTKEMQFQIIISRVFCLAKKKPNIKVEDPQLLQFAEICNDVYQHFRNVYEAILLSEMFELNERKYMSLFVEYGKSQEFRLQSSAEMGQGILNFLNGKGGSKEELLEGIQLWDDFINLMNYLEQKKHKSQLQVINIASLMNEANEYLKEKLK